MSDQAQRGMRDDEPLMKAWNAHKATAEFANTLRWAGESNMGQLWAEFSAGWKAAGGIVEDR